MHRVVTRPHTTTWTYHPSLDGLRSLAVYLVVLYHCGVAIAGGGFVGVDLFFVLSGFLVTTIMLEELSATGRLDLVHFYDRRVRRLLPAAVVVIVTICAVSVVFLSSVRRAPLVGDAQSALLYVSNWHFLTQSNDYFASAGVDNSLFLHFWSLSIEEQFYVAFPILLLALTRLERRWRHTTAAVLVGLLVASLAAQVWWSMVDVNHAYYGTETRLYQLLAGALLGLVLHRMRHATRANRAGDSRPRLVAAVAFVSLCGMALVATPLLAVSPSNRGILATCCAVPLVATLALTETHVVAHVFAHPALVHLGKISYSTYLWHWPVVVLLREVVSASAAVTAAIVVVLSTALAAASFQMLERPIRARRVPRPLRSSVLASGLVISVTAAVLVVPTLLNREGTPDLAVERQASVGTAANVEGSVPDIDFEAVADDKGWDEQYCPVGKAAECVVVDGQAGPDVMLVGDSHARMLGPALGALAKRHHFNLSVQILGGCPWPRGLVNINRPQRGQEECAQARDELYTTILEESGTDVVILTQQARDTGLWADQLAREPGAPAPDSLDYLLHDTTEKTLSGLADDGIRSLVVHSIWLPPPSFGNPLDCLAGAERVQQCRVPISPEPGRQDAYYLAAASHLDDVYTVDINPTICPAVPVCDPVLGGIPVWRDPGHYTPSVILDQRSEVWAAIETSGVFDGLL